MITIGDKQYRNLQEQVLKNKDDIATIKEGNTIAELGIKIINAEYPLEDASQLPSAQTYDGNYGDGYIVGSETPFTLYVYSRSSDPSVKGFWFDYGLLNAPSTIQGPEGKQGPIGPQGTRGSLWYTQTGAPTNTVGVNANDQALDGSNGNVYQFNNGAWQLVGNIRGPQGLQGIQGIQGLVGPTGPVGPQGPKGDPASPVEIYGELENTSQLPLPDSVPRYAAYLIPDTNGDQHIWLQIGEGTTESPILWHDAGKFSNNGTTITIDGVNQNSVELGYVPKISQTIQVGESTTVSSNGSEVTISNLQATGYNVNNEQIEGETTLELPIASSDEIEFKAVSNTIKANLTTAVKNEIIDLALQSGAWPVIQIEAPTTATNGTLTEEQFSMIQQYSFAVTLAFNNELYKLQDLNNTPGYIIFSHVGYENTTDKYMVKCITVQISTRTWVLTTKTLIDPQEAITGSSPYVATVIADASNTLYSGNTLTVTANISFVLKPGQKILFIQKDLPTMDAVAYRMNFKQNSNQVYPYPMLWNGAGTYLNSSSTANQVQAERTVYTPLALSGTRIWELEYVDATTAIAQGFTTTGSNTTLNPNPAINGYLRITPKVQVRVLSDMRTSSGVNNKLYIPPACLKSMWAISTTNNNQDTVDSIMIDPYTFVTSTGSSTMRLYLRNNLEESKLFQIYYSTQTINNLVVPTYGITYPTGSNIDSFKIFGIM